MNSGDLFPRIEKEEEKEKGKETMKEIPRIARVEFLMNSGDFFLKEEEKLGMKELILRMEKQKLKQKEEEEEKETMLSIKKKKKKKERLKEREKVWKEIFSSKEEEEEKGKFGLICLEDINSRHLETYRIRIFDDAKHNDQHPHLCRIIPPGFVPFPTTESGIPFHSNPNTISLKPTTPPPPHGIACGRFSSVLGSNTTVFHIAKDESTGTTKVATINLTTPYSNWVLLPPPPMPSDPLQVHALFLCNKLYCLGSYKEEKPWIVAYDPSLNQWESLPGPSDRPIHIFFSVAIEIPSPTIIVGSTLGHLQVYDVASKTWKLQKFENTDNEFIPFPKNQPVVVGSKFYWYEHCKHRLVGYDWLTKEWYLADVHNMHDCGECLEEDLCLAHIAGDNFCLFWKSLTGSDTFRIHCLKFQVAKHRPIVGSTYFLAASISTPCQSYVFSGLKSFLNGLVGYSQSIAWDYLGIGLVVWNTIICHTNSNWKTNQFELAH